MMRRLLVVAAIVAGVVVSGVHVSWSAIRPVDGVTPAEAREGTVPGFGRYTRAHCRTGQFFDASVCRLGDYRGDFTVPEIDLLLARAFPESSSIARCVAQGESTYRSPTSKTGRYASNRAGAQGLMQVLSSWNGDAAAVYGITRADMFEVGPNLVMARYVHDRQGWWAWSTYPGCRR